MFIPRANRVASSAPSTGSAGHAGAIASAQLTFNLDHSMKAGHPSAMALIRQAYDLVAE